MSADSNLFKKIGDLLDSISKQYNFQVARISPAGKPASDKSGGREYRMQLINSSNDTSESYKNILSKLISSSISGAKDIRFNELSSNSSKYSSVSFTYEGTGFDVIISKGSNKGENFEKKVVSDLKGFFTNKGISTDYKTLVQQLTTANPKFGKNEIKDVKQRTGSTKKEGIAIEKLGEIIGDIVLTDSQNQKWFISLKDVNGDTFSSYSGAASLIDSSGTVAPKSPGADFLNAFGVDLNRVQEGYDIRAKNKKLPNRKPIAKSRLDTSKVKAIFERAWGMNYFYVRKTGGGWKVFWIDRKKLDNLTSNIKVDDIKYPSASSKQITIICSNGYAEYMIEIRNSKGGEYPNDTKFKVKALK
jgi:hypothetical protein